MKKKFETSLPPFTAEKVLTRSAGQVIDYWHGLMQSLPMHSKTKGEKAAICVADTSPLWTHDDLPKRGNQYAINATGETVDGNGHGHACAGIIGAIDNGIGTIGIAPESLLIPGSCLNKDGSGVWSWFAKVARDYADADLGEFNDRIRILTASLGGPSHSQAVEDALKYAKSKGVIVVVAAGNRGYTEKVDTIDYPGKLDELVITVGSIGRTWSPSYFSSAGEALDVVAWGESIYTLNHQNQEWRVSGTSFATPMVAGLCGLIASKHYDVFKNAKPADRKDIMEAFLKKYAKDLLTPGEDDRTGAGATVAKPYIDNQPDAPANDPEDPGEDPGQDPGEDPQEPGEPTGKMLASSTFRCNVIYRDHRADTKSIFSNPGGYTLDVEVQLEFPKDIDDHWLNMAMNNVETVGFVHRQVTLVSTQDTDFLRKYPLMRIRFLDGQPDASIQSIARYFGAQTQKQMDEWVPDAKAKVLTVKVDNGFVAAST